MPIPEEEEGSDDNEKSEVEQLSSEGQASLNQNKEEASIKSEKYSEPSEAPLKQENNEQLQGLTDSMANMNTEEPKSTTVTAKPTSQNESGQENSKEEQTISVSTPVTQENTTTNDASNTVFEKGI